ncbi:MAG: DUF3276 family protein [Planctomycetes bacterium]|nr:DUF3276 family protein [Planctomycetota bacterium]
MEQKKGLFNKVVKAGQRNYFFDVREAKNGNKYLLISESRVNKDGKKESSCILIFNNALSNFTDGLKEAVAVCK